MNLRLERTLGGLKGNLAGVVVLGLRPVPTRVTFNRAPLQMAIISHHPPSALLRPVGKGCHTFVHPSHIIMPKKHQQPSSSTARTPAFPHPSQRPGRIDSQLHVMTVQEQQEKRIKRGWCPKCGLVQTHKRAMFGMGRVPLVGVGCLIVTLCDVL